MILLKHEEIYQSKKSSSKLRVIEVSDPPSVHPLLAGVASSHRLSVGPECGRHSDRGVRRYSVQDDTQGSATNCNTGKYEE